MQFFCGRSSSLQGLFSSSSSPFSPSSPCPLPGDILWSTLLVVIFISLPLAWGYIVVNLACGNYIVGGLVTVGVPKQTTTKMQMKPPGYLFGFLYGLIVTVITATAGILAAHLIIMVCHHCHLSNHEHHQRHHDLHQRCLASHVRKLLHTSEYSKSLYAVISGPQVVFHIMLYWSCYLSFLQ